VLQGRHHEPPEVASLFPLPVLAVGAEPELKPLLVLLELLVLFLLFWVLCVLPVLCVPLLVLCVLLVPVPVLAWVLDPGSAKATTPAATTLVALTAAVAERTRACPRALAATARPILSRFMGSILGRRGRSCLWPGSQPSLTAQFLSTPGRYAPNLKGCSAFAQDEPVTPWCRKAVSRRSPGEPAAAYGG
jgi:hypothetical protein